MSAIPEVIPEQDKLAVSVAIAVATANIVARQAGVNVEDSRLLVSQQWTEKGAVWRISYGPKDFPNRRGGSYSVEINADDGSVVRALREQ